MYAAVETHLPHPHAMPVYMERMLHQKK